jgi:anti-sigma-K factor RskA
VNTQDTLHDLVAPYALDALDAADRERFEAHLDDCAGCRRDLAVLQRGADALAWAAEGPEPPAELRERILEQVRGEAQVIPETPAPEAQVIPLRPRRRWVAPALGAVAAAAAVVAVGLGLWGASLSNDLDRERDLSAAQAEALELVADPDARVVQLEGAEGSLIVGQSGRAALVVCGLEPAPSGQTYEAWTIRGTPTPAGLFDAGEGCTPVALEGTVAPGVTVAVTREQEGGVEAPTTDPIFSAQVA